MAKCTTKNCLNDAVVGKNKCNFHLRPRKREYVCITLLFLFLLGSATELSAQALKLPMPIFSYSSDVRVTGLRKRANYEIFVGSNVGKDDEGYPKYATRFTAVVDSRDVVGFQVEMALACEMIANQWHLEDKIHDRNEKGVTVDVFGYLFILKYIPEKGYCILDLTSQILTVGGDYFDLWDTMRSAIEGYCIQMPR